VINVVPNFSTDDADLAALYGDDIAFAMKAPEVVSLRMVPSVQTENRHIHEPMISKRRCLLIGNAVEEHTEFHQLGQALSGGLSQDDYDPSLSQSILETLCQGDPLQPSWVRSQQQFRVSTGQTYEVSHINKVCSDVRDEVQIYLDNIAHGASDSDFLLVIIDGHRLSNLEKPVNPRPIADYDRFLQVLNAHPGWKCVIDLSRDCGELNNAYLNDIISKDHSLNKTALITVATAEQIPSVGHVQGCWSYILNSILFNHTLHQFDLRSLMTAESREDRIYAMVPQIRSNFTVAL
jgi:hypothetical protein